MTNDSIKLAQLWVQYKELKDKLDNEIIPVSGYLQVDDPDLMIAMGQLSETIGRHLNEFKLTAEIVKTKTAQ